MGEGDGEQEKGKVIFLSIKSCPGRSTNPKETGKPKGPGKNKNV